MTHARTRSGASRVTLLLIAALHFLSAATLPFTHRHAVRDAIGTVSATDDARRAGSDADLHPCTICRTLAATYTSAPASLLAAAPVLTIVQAAPAADGRTPTARRTTAQSRAPPRI